MVGRTGSRDAVDMSNSVTLGFMCTTGGCEWIVPILLGIMVTGVLLVVGAAVVVVKLFNQMRAEPAMGLGGILWRSVVIMGCLWFVVSATGGVFGWG
jgi:hypothetical protein